LQYTYKQVNNGHDKEGVCQASASHGVGCHMPHRISS
jgi:hypothetical protein